MSVRNAIASATSERRFTGTAREQVTDLEGVALRLD